MDVLDDILRRFGLTPATHDDADHIVIRKVIALEWWRMFPTVAAGQITLDLGPDLTSDVLMRLMEKASLCFLEGDRFDLYDIFVD
jgi:hypothetical protein